MSRRVSFRVSLLIDDGKTIRQVRGHLQDLLRSRLESYPEITGFPQSVLVTHMREPMTFKRRLLRWLEGRLR